MKNYGRIIIFSIIFGRRYIVAMKETIGKKFPQLANFLVLFMIALDAFIIFTFSKLGLENSSVAVAIILGTFVKVLLFIITETKYGGE